MSYGWEQALRGMFPAIGHTINFAPSFAGEKSKFSGCLEMSIRNRQVVYLLYRLIRDLPIRDILKYRFFKRGK
jgi:hypothetical protein